LTLCVGGDDRADAVFPVRHRKTPNSLSAGCGWRISRRR
jgi:hypothetical protein